MSDELYYQKYLKYKAKYLELKYGGGNVKKYIFNFCSADNKCEEKEVMLNKNTSDYFVYDLERLLKKDTEIKFVEGTILLIGDNAKKIFESEYNKYIEAEKKKIKEVIEESKSRRRRR
jgi:hypothetical protein